MKFGKVDRPEKLDLFLPQDHPQTIDVLSRSSGNLNQVCMGTPRWAKAAFPSFYPRGTKDELAYYSKHFNAIELNAFYYRIFPPKVVESWYNRSEDGFTFFPKVPQLISQFRRLKNCEQEMDDFFTSISHFQEKLGTCLLQMNETFSPQNKEDLYAFIKRWPVDVKLAVELRNANWYNNDVVSSELCSVLEDYNICHVLTDTPGRRDLMHMRLTNSSCFVRFTGANVASDYTRLDEWVARLKQWKEQGIEEINFFIHQAEEKELVQLSQLFVSKINPKWDMNLPIPTVDSK